MGVGVKVSGKVRMCAWEGSGHCPLLIIPHVTSHRISSSHPIIPPSPRPLVVRRGVQVDVVHRDGLVVVAESRPQVPLPHVDE